MFRYLPHPRHALMFAAWLIMTPALAQSPPLPPERPYDLRLPPGRAPALVTPPVQRGGPAGPGSGALVAAPLPPTRPESFALKPVASRTAAAAAQPPAEEAPPTPQPAPQPPPAAPQAPDAAPSWFPREWPRLLPGQQEKNEPQISDKALIARGLSTDPGTSITCLPDRLKSILNQVISRYGGVHVTSTWRPAWRARRGSYHRKCEAVDFRVEGIAPREVLRFVSTLPETGGRKVYWNGLLHVDTGPARSW